MKSQFVSIQPNGDLAGFEMSHIDEDSKLKTAGLHTYSFVPGVDYSQVLCDLRQKLASFSSVNEKNKVFLAIEAKRVKDLQQKQSYLKTLISQYSELSKTHLSSVPEDVKEQKSRLASEITSTKQTIEQLEKPTVSDVEGYSFYDQKTKMQKIEKKIKLVQFIMDRMLIGEISESCGVCIECYHVQCSLAACPHCFYNDGSIR